MHPSIKILCLFGLALAVHALRYQGLLALMGLLVACLFYYHATGFLHLLKRIRLLLIFLIVIFAFNTPGEYLPQWPFALAPTYEGLKAGLVTGLRLCIMLAGLSVLLATTGRDSLISGFFWLAYPLRYLKLKPERFAARLWLTLHYVEHAEVTQPKRGFFEHLASLKTANEHIDDGQQRIQLISPVLSWRDGLAVLFLLATGIYLL